MNRIVQVCLSIVTTICLSCSGFGQQLATGEVVPRLIHFSGALKDPARKASQGTVALNEDFRYQLTSIGRPAPNLYVSEKVAGNRFRVAGGAPGAEVSWQVTGIRHDAWAKAHPQVVEEEKPQQERGHYLNAESFGQSAELSVGSVKVGPMIKHNGKPGTIK